jgi:hypothetical protein
MTPNLEVNQDLKEHSYQAVVLCTTPAPQMSEAPSNLGTMKTIEVMLFWLNKIWPWIVIPTLIFGAMLVALIWGEAKKGIRS